MELAAGAFLATAGDHGLRVYAWDEALRARDQMPTPRFQAEAELVEDDGETANMRMNGTYALAPDWTAWRLLYGGMEGKISFIDLETSGHGTLVSIRGRPQIMDLGFRASFAHLQPIRRWRILGQCASSRRRCSRAP